MCQPWGLSDPRLCSISEQRCFQEEITEKCKSQASVLAPDFRESWSKTSPYGCASRRWLNEKTRNLMGKFCTSPALGSPSSHRAPSVIAHDSEDAATPTPPGPSSLQPQLPHSSLPPHLSNSGKSHRPSQRIQIACALPPQGLCTCCSRHQEHTSSCPLKTTS